MSPRPRATSDETILSAAYRVVSRLGPNLTLADVAKEAGVSPATLVQRFGSKRALLLALSAGASGSVGDEFARIRTAHRSPLAALYAVGDCMAAMADTPEIMANSLAFLQLDLTDPEFRTHAHKHSRATLAEMKRLLDAAVRAGELRPSNTANLARALQSLMGGSLLQWAIDRDGTAAERIRADFDALLGPLRLRGRQRRGNAKTTRRAGQPSR